MKKIMMLMEEREREILKIRQKIESRQGLSKGGRNWQREKSREVKRSTDRQQATRKMQRPDRHRERRVISC